MSDSTLTVIMTIVLIGLSGYSGKRLADKGKPYGKLETLIHILLSIGLMAVASTFLGNSARALGNSDLMANILFITYAVSAPLSFVLGILLLFGKQVRKSLTVSHKLFSVIMILSVLVAVVRELAG